MTYQTRDGKTRIASGGGQVVYDTGAGAGWRDSYKRYEQNKKIIKERRGVMTTLERQLADEALERELQAVLATASKGMEAEILEAAERVKRREKVLKSYKAAEADAWDPAKQQVAYTGMTNRLQEAALDNMTGGAKFRAIYEDAKNSKYALVAFSELAPKYARQASDPELNKMAVLAGRQVQELQNTPAIKEKQGDLDKAVIELGGKLKEASQVHQVIYDADINDPLYANSLARTAKRIAWSDNGELDILEADDGKVTGVYYGVLNEVQGG